MSELDYLTLSVVLFSGTIFAQAVFANIAHDPKTLLGPRDGFVSEDKYVQRAKRTTANMIEAMVMFAPLVLIDAAQGGLGAGLSGLGAALFFWSRLAYAIVYIAGVPVVRSLFWFGGFIGTGLVLWDVAPFV